MFPFVCNKYIDDCIYYYNGAYNIPLTILLYCMGKYKYVYCTIVSVYRCTNRFNDILYTPYVVSLQESKYIRWNILCGQNVTSKAEKYTIVVFGPFQYL